MRDSLLYLSAAIGALAASPVLAGENFFGRTVGSFEFTDPDPPVLTGTIDQFFIIMKGPAVFEGLAMTFELTRHDSGPDDMVGTFTFFGSNPADSLSGTYTGFNFPNEDGIWTGAGSWTALDGAGAFEGFTGEGTLTTALFTGDGSAATAFDGVIVPTPSAAALGAALLFVPRRRRAL